MRIKLTGTAGYRGKTRFTLKASDDKKVKLPAGLTIPESAGQTIITTLPAKSGPMELIVSLGKEEKIDAEMVRRAGGAIAKWLRANKVASAGVETVPTSIMSETDCVVALAEGLILGDYQFDRLKSERKPFKASVDILVRKTNAKMTTALRQVQRFCDGTILARDISHEPPNVINPVTLAAKARTIARKAGLKCTILDDKQLAKLKANALLAVGKGSATPSRMVILEYPGRGATTAKPVVLVGKALTFDTGGYSLKTRDGIVGMKYDKCGGTAVLGAMQAIAACRPKVPVIGILAAAENMIAGNAYRPNDIITTMSGKTVEIISADAEGRMALCDALTYAQKKYKPRCLIDVATLTGGAVVALGNSAAAIFCDDDKLRDGLIESGTQTYERLWPLPLWDDYFDAIKGDDSDFKNSGGRGGHASIGAVFLKQFVDSKIPWAHLDIAGMGDTDRDLPYCPKGGTGFGVRLLLDYITRL